MAHVAHEPTLDRAQVTLRRGGLAAKLPLIFGVAGLALLALTFAMGKGDQLFRSYQLAWLYFVTLGLGGLFFVLLQHLTRAGWSVTVRRLAENVALTLPLLAVLGIPLGFGLHSLYEWSHAEAVAHDPLLQHKSAWLSPSIFLGRAALYLLLWSVLAVWFWRQSQRQDTMGAVALTRRMQTLSAPAMVIFGITLTLAAFDWVMSLAPHWYSTVFGVYIFAGVAISAMAVLIILALLLQRAGLLEGIVTFDHLHDLGKLLFAFVVFWAYIAFSQFMLIWYGNLPEETVWFAARWTPGWKPVSIALAVSHFVLPFFFLLLRDIKRNRLGLMFSAIWMLLVHALDLFWVVRPAFGDAPQVHALDFVAFFAIGCVWAAALSWALLQRALVPVSDPRLAESLAFENV